MDSATAWAANKPLDFLEGVVEENPFWLRIREYKAYNWFAKIRTSKQKQLDAAWLRLEEEVSRKIDACEVVPFRMAERHFDHILYDIGIKHTLCFMSAEDGEVVVTLPVSDFCGMLKADPRTIKNSERISLRDTVRRLNYR